MNLTRDQAFIELCSGKKIRKYYWADNEYVSLNKDCLFDEKENNVNFDVIFISDDKYEIYNEEKKLITIAPAIYFDENNKMMKFTTGLFKSEKDAKEDLGSSFIKWCDNELSIEVLV